MTVLTQNPTMGDLLKWEDNPNFSRESGTLATNGAKLLLGTVLGRGRVSGTVTVSAAVADATNTGNGTLTLAGTPYVAGSVKEGNYRATYLSATKFQVSDPSGKPIGEGSNGVAYTGPGIAFTLAAGGTAFVAGDSFVIPVSIAGNAGKLYPWDPTASDGTEDVEGVLLQDTDVTSADQPCMYLRREALVSQNALLWKSGLTAAQISDGIAALGRRGIAVRVTA